MTDLSIDHLKHLLAEERRRLPEMKWTYKGVDASSIYHDYPSKHEEIYGVREEMEVSRYSPLTPALAEEAIRLRGRIEGLILEMETKAANNEWQDPSIIASYLKEKVLGETNE